MLCHAPGRWYDRLRPLLPFLYLLPKLLPRERVTSIKVGDIALGIIANGNGKHHEFSAEETQIVRSYSFFGTERTKLGGVSNLFLKPWGVMTRREAIVS
jgi:hypothetical protein